MTHLKIVLPTLPIEELRIVIVHLKRDGTRAETRFRLAETDESI
jgi:hypothetical protein